MRLTMTQIQQFLFFTAWAWPMGVLLSGGTSNAKDVEAGMFWAFVWLICSIRLYSKRAWPFSLAKKSEPHLRHKASQLPKVARREPTTTLESESHTPAPPKPVQSASPDPPTLVASSIAGSFSSKQFQKFFANKSLDTGWTPDDALAIWYCLGYFCLLISVGSAAGIKETAGAALLDSGLKSMLEIWQMHEASFQRFERFNRTKLTDVFALYASIADGQKFRKFFGLFVSEILGEDVSFSPGSLVGGAFMQILDGKQPDTDIVLHQSICKMFVEVQKNVQQIIDANPTLKLQEDSEDYRSKSSLPVTEGRSMHSPKVEQSSDVDTLEIEHQIDSAIEQKRWVEARALIESELAKMPADWKPMQRDGDSLICAFWDQEEFLSFTTHRQLSGNEMTTWAGQSYSKRWWQLAIINRKQGKQSDALTCIERGIALEPDHPNLWVQKGLCFADTKQFAQALKAFETAATVRPWASAKTTAWALRQCGYSLIELNRLTEAQIVYRRAMDLDPDEPNAKHELEYIESQLQLKGVPNPLRTQQTDAVGEGDHAAHSATQGADSLQQNSSASPRQGTTLDEVPYKVNQDFRDCFVIALDHIQSMGKGEVYWTLKQFNPFSLEHFLFRLGNQFFLVLIRDAESVDRFPGKVEGLLAVANGFQGYPCLMPMKRESGHWVPALPGWGLVDARSGSPIEPPRLVTDTPIEMTDWELHDFAVQYVRGWIQQQEKKLISWQNDPHRFPSIWFSDEDGPAWIVIRSGRYPSIPTLSDYVRARVLADADLARTRGFFASIGVASPDTLDKSNKLFRGAGLYVRFTGLEPINLPQPSPPSPIDPRIDPNQSPSPERLKEVWDAWRQGGKEGLSQLFAENEREESSKKRTIN